MSLLIFLAWLARAETLESRSLTELARAREPAQVAAVRARFENARVARLACEIEKREGLIPLSCYEVAGEDRRELDQRCHVVAAALRVPDYTAIPKFVSPTCLADVREAHKIQDYRRSPE